MKRRYISYYRVSTKRQGDSGLGLEAQRRQVNEFVSSRGAEIIDEFTETESGRDDDRPELAKALNASALYGVPLVIAKLDRLSRSAAFLMKLQESGVQFVCADMPEVCDMTIGVMACVARYEAEQISKRTKSALAEAKARGVKLGGGSGNGHLLTDEARAKAHEKRRENSRKRAERYRALIVEAVKLGCVNYNQIARMLTEEGVPTPSGRGTVWQGGQAKRIVEQLGLELVKTDDEQE